MEGFFDAAAERLRQRCPVLLQVQTGMSRDLVETMTLSQEVSALVHPLSEAADPVNHASLLVSQREAWVFGVMLALTYPGGFAEWEPAKAQVKAALRGWTWEERLAQPVAYVGGATLQYSIAQDGGRWLFLMRFSLATRETYPHQT